MANILNTRIRLKYDTLANWSSNNPTLLEGELAIVSIPNGATQEVNSVSAPQILFKVGPGEFNSLPYASGKAADVYTWAKLAGADVFKKDGNGNVISGIEYDATANDGKGGFKFTTASVATSEGLEEVNNALAELTKEVYGEDGSANASRIDALEERMTAEENKVDNDTTYTFAKTTKGFSVTPKGGEAQTITFEYLTAEEVASAIEAYGYKDEAGVKAIVESYGYQTRSDIMNYGFAMQSELVSFRKAAAQDVIDNAIKADVDAIEAILNGEGSHPGLVSRVESVDTGLVSVHHEISRLDSEIYGTSYSTGLTSRIDTLEDGVANWNDKYTKEEIDGKVNTINEAINGKVAQSDYNTKMGELDGSISSINGTLATKADASSLNNYYTKDETYNSTTIDSKIEAAEGRANGYADKAVSDFKDFLLGSGATDAIDTIKDLSDALASHEDAYDALLETVGKKAEKTEVEKVAGDLNALENHIGYVSTDDKTLVEAIDERFATKEEVEGVSKTVSDLSTSTDSRLDAIEAQIGLGGGDSETGSVTEQLAAHALTLEDHEGRIAANEGAIKALNETTIPGLDSRIKTLEDNPYELPSDVVQDANYKHITVTETSVSDGTTTFTKYDDTALAGKVETATIELYGDNTKENPGLVNRVEDIELDLRGRSSDDPGVIHKIRVLGEVTENLDTRVSDIDKRVEQTEEEID